MHETLSRSINTIFVDFDFGGDCDFSNDFSPDHRMPKQKRMRSVSHRIDDERLSTIRNLTKMTTNSDRVAITV